MHQYLDANDKSTLMLQIAARWVRTMEELGDRFSKPRPAPGSVPSAKVTRVRALADLVHYTQAVRFVSFSGRDGSLSALLFFYNFHEGFAVRFVSCALPPGTVSDVVGELARAGIPPLWRHSVVPKHSTLRSQLRLICHVACLFFLLTNGMNLSVSRGEAGPPVRNVLVPRRQGPEARGGVRQGLCALQHKVCIAAHMTMQVTRAGG
jgi:hypothetical protein